MAYRSQLLRKPLRYTTFGKPLGHKCQKMLYYKIFTTTWRTLLPKETIRGTTVVVCRPSVYLITPPQVGPLHFKSSSNIYRGTATTQLNVLALQSNLLRTPEYKTFARGWHVIPIRWYEQRYYMCTRVREFEMHPQLRWNVLYYYYTKISGTGYVVPGTYLGGFWPWRLLPTTRPEPWP